MRSSPSDFQTLIKCYATLMKEEWKILRFEREECRWRVLSVDLTQLHMRNKKSWATEAIPVLTDWPVYESHELLEPDRVKLTSSIWGVGLVLTQVWMVSCERPQKLCSFLL